MELFTQEGNTVEATNVRVNLLTCRYERSSGQPSRRLKRELSNLVESFRGDWRRRKVLVLLARSAERRGDLPTAIDLARQAVDAPENQPTRHRLDDQAYLRLLEGLQGERSRTPGHTPEEPGDGA